MILETSFFNVIHIFKRLKTKLFKQYAQKNDGNS